MRLAILFWLALSCAVSADEAMPAKMDKKSPRTLYATAAAISDMDKIRALVPVSKATCKVIRSGLWSDPQNWEGGRKPGDKDTFFVPKGLDILPDESATFTDGLVHGRLIPFAKVGDVFPCLAEFEKFLQGKQDLEGLALIAQLRPIVNKYNQSQAVIDFKFNTLFAEEGSEILVGLHIAGFPGEFNVTFRDLGPIDPKVDPWMIGRGIVYCGKYLLYGREITPYALMQGAKAGDRVILLKEPVVGWAAGDPLFIPGVSPTTIDDDQCVIESIQTDRLVTVVLKEPLKFNHPAQDREGKPKKMAVANLKRRSINFTSENKTDPQRAGHTMGMSHGDMGDDPEELLWEQWYVWKDFVGRTDKSKRVTDPDGMGNGTENPRGRYGDHDHKRYNSPNGPRAHRTGNLYTNSPGWHDAVHASCSDLTNNAYLWSVGADAVGEIGNESGLFARNLFLRSKAPVWPKGVPPNKIDDDNDPDIQNRDWFKYGSGPCWMAGGIEVRENMIFGKPAPALVVTGSRFDNTVWFDTKNLPYGYTYPQPQILPRYVPQRVTANESTGCGNGLDVWRLNQDNLEVPPIDWSHFADESHECQHGCGTRYNVFAEWRNLRVVRSTADYSSGLGMSNVATQKALRFIGGEIHGFSIGMAINLRGPGLVENFKYRTGTGFQLSTAGSEPLNLAINGSSMLPIPVSTRQVLVKTPALLPSQVVTVDGVPVR